MAALLSTKHNQEKLGPKHQIITINKQKCKKFYSKNSVFKGSLFAVFHFLANLIKFKNSDKLYILWGGFVQNSVMKLGFKYF